MIALSQNSAKIWLSIPEYPLEAIPTSAYIRCSLTTTVKNILEKCHNWVSTESANNQETEYTWDNSYAEKLAFQVQAIPEILQQSATEIAPHLLTRQLESISDNCHLWYKSFDFSANNCILLSAIQQTFFDLLENILEIKIPVFTQS